MKTKVLVLLLLTVALVLGMASCKKDPPALTDLVVDTSGISTQYVVGATPDFSGLKATAVYDDGSEVALGYADLTVGAISTQKAGTKKLTVTYETITKTIDITVNEKPAPTLASIKLLAGEVETTVFKGAVVDLSKLQVEGTYSDGSKKSIAIADVTLSTLDTSTAGEKTLTATYQGKTATLTFTVLGVDSMSVVSSSINSRVLIGGTVNTANLQVMVSYGKGNAILVEADKLTIGTVDTSTAGVKNLSITYDGNTIQYPITVVGAALEIHASSVASKVYLGDTLDLSRITAGLTYTDGAKDLITTGQLTVKQNVDTSVAGKQTLTVAYGSYEASIEVNVIGVIKLEVIGGLESEIKLGETFDTSAISVRVTYADETTTVVYASSLALENVDVTTGGNKTLNFKFNGVSGHYSFKVCTVSSIRIEGLPITVPSGVAIDVSGLIVKGVYNNSTKDEILLTDGITTNVGSIDINSTTDKTIIVTYDGSYGKFTASHVVSATAPALVRVEIRTYPTYVATGDAYDTSKVAVFAVYGNGTEVKVNDAVIAYNNGTLTASYHDKTDSKTVSVLPVTKLEVSGIANLVNKGAALNTDGVVVVATFSDGTNTVTKTVGKADGVTVSDPDTASAGDKTLTVSYRGGSASVAYHVKGVTGIAYYGGLVDKLYAGVPVNTANLQVTVSYTNNTSAVLYYGALTGATTALNGTAFTVSYEGYSFTHNFSSTLYPTFITSLTGSLPKIVYKGAAFDYSKAQLSVTYEFKIGKDTYYDVVLIDGTNPNLEIVEINTNVAGEQGITFKFTAPNAKGGTSVHETNFTVVVRGVVEGGLKYIDGMETSIMVGQQVDASTIEYSVTFTDGYIIYVKRDGTGNFGSSDLLVVGEIDTSSAGVKNLVISYLDAQTVVPVTVMSVDANSGAILGIERPDNLVVRESYKTAFKDQDQGYIVGNDNPYYFYANVLKRVDVNGTPKLMYVDGKSVASTIKVYENGTELTGAALDAVVAVNSAANANSLQFTDAALNRTFTVTSIPNGWNGTPVTNTVTVKDGYNVYSENELLLMNNSWEDIDGNYTANKALDDQWKVVRDFLATKGIDYTKYVGNLDVEAPKLHGMILHRNLDVKVENVPPEYIYSDANGNYGLYDHLGIYTYAMDYANTTFEIYGNYYSVYSYNLPNVVKKGIANNDDDYSSSNLFKVRGAGMNPNAGTPDKSRFFNVSNLAIRDNDPNSNDQTASERHMRGLIGMKIGGVVSNIYNVCADAYQNTLNLDTANTTANLNKVNFYNAWNIHIMTWPNNMLQSDNNANAGTGVYGIELNIKESRIGKCGGPVILTQNPNRELKSNTQIGTTIQVDQTSELFSYVTGQEAWFVANYQTQLASQILAMNALLPISGNQPNGVTGTYLSNEKITGVDTVNMVMVNMGTGISVGDVGTINATFKRGTFDAAGNFTPTVTGLHMGVDRNGVPVNVDVETYKTVTAMLNTETGESAPIFQSSGGGIAFTDGKTGVYGLSFAANGMPTGQTAPSAAFSQGDYFTLYYMGVGIMLEYYH